ncbi:uncharacterized protein LOC107042146 [Diachasma alloeum]|uniref:uncharacterized protein LOC107042146 n=1 Tax=Diachasma alloeum TaxID=454923 RepID=UPI00073836BA|nr:uncharacterized protein LOC107042146 [Diachasma alloeum]
MSLFKVVSHERTDRFAIIASTITEVVTKGIEKLNLPAAKYQVLVEKDGTVIDEDDILLAMAKISGVTLVLMLLREGIAYKSQLDQSIVNQSSERVPQDVTSTSPIRQASMGECSQTRTNFRDTLWDKIPSDIMRQCREGVRVSEDQRRELVTQLKIYMMNDLKDATRGTAHAISQAICEKYPNSVQDQIDGIKLGRGYEALAAQLYNAVGNVSRKRKAGNKGARLHATGANLDDEATDDASAPKSRKHDEYGCAEGKYDPQLPPDETVESLEAKRLKLIAYHDDSIDPKDERVRTLLNETYAIQRRSIIACSSIDAGFFAKWPYLQNGPALFRHAGELLGITDIQEKWQTALQKYADPMKKFVKAEEVIKNHKKKGKIADADMFVEKTLQAARVEATIVTRSDIPLVAAIFPLIVHHFGETQDALYVIVDESLTEGETLEKFPCPTPTLVVKGKSLCSENATYFVGLDKTSLIPIDGVYNGILLTFLSYYMFRIWYPKDLALTLELIQRYFLMINPLEGSKKGNKKRQSMSFDPKVVKFMNGVERYQQDS